MDGFTLAKKITEKYGKTFYFASRFLNKEKRKAAYAIYALCRISDESVDAKEGLLCQQDLALIKKKIDSAYNNASSTEPLLSAFQQTVNNYSVPKKYFDALLEGMRMDLEKNRYQTFEELYDYCYKVAGVVGLIMADIFGYSDQKAADHAINLGIAMQLTNILRDIKEDFGRGRIYLPLDEMQRFKVSEADISEHRVTGNFKALIRFQITRAREYYENGKQGIKMISDPNSRLIALAMAEIYAGILEIIEKNGYDIFGRRAYVSCPKKIVALLKILLKGEYR